MSMCVSLRRRKGLYMRCEGFSSQNQLIPYMQLESKQEKFVKEQAACVKKLHALSSK